jgi:hypothetical protein
VTKFDLADDYLSRFEPHSRRGQACRVLYSCGQLPSFHRAIIGAIAVEEAFFGPKGKGAVEQFVVLTKIADYSRMDFACEVSANRKAIWLNSWLWGAARLRGSRHTRAAQTRPDGPAPAGMGVQRVNIPLPPAFSKNE